MRRFGLGALLAVAVGLSCAQESGVLVAASWDPGISVEAIEAAVSVSARPPVTERFASPSGSLTSPYRVRVESSPDEPIEVALQAMGAGRVVASGRISVTPSHGEYLEVALHLEAAPPPRCSDGVVDPGEECDDGNREDRDGCTNACTCARCGDGILRLFPNAPGDTCPGVAEECDDGNTAGGDGCSATCTRE
jgi:cysteine-rich repeat protein